MNKLEIKKRISQIKTKSEFLILQDELKGYKSINSVISLLEYKENTGSLGSSSWGGNRDEIIKSLNIIVDSYSSKKENRFNFKYILTYIKDSMKYLINLFFK